MSKYSASHQYVQDLVSLPSVQATKRQLLGHEVTSLRGVVSAALGEAGFKVDLEMLRKIKKGMSFVVFTPDSRGLCVELNKAVRARLGDEAPVFRPERGYEAGKINNLEVYAEDFRSFGREDLAEGLTPENLDERRKDFSHGTLSLRKIAYSWAGKPRYMSQAAATMDGSVFKLTVRDSQISFPDSWETRTQGNVYCVVLDTVEAAIEATTRAVVARLEERKAEAERKAAEKAAAKAARESAKEHEKAKE